MSIRSAVNPIAATASFRLAAGAGADAEMADGVVVDGVFSGGGRMGSGRAVFGVGVAAISDL